MDKKQFNIGRNEKFAADKKNFFVKTAIIPLLEGYSSRKEWEETSWQKILESGEILPLLITSHERHDLVIRAAVME